MERVEVLKTKDDIGSVKLIIESWNETVRQEKAIERILGGSGMLRN